MTRYYITAEDETEDVNKIVCWFDSFLREAHLL